MARSRFAISAIGCTVTNGQRPTNERSRTEPLAVRHGIGLLRGPGLRRYLWGPAAGASVLPCIWPQPSGPLFKGNSIRLAPDSAEVFYPRRRAPSPSDPPRPALRRGRVYDGDGGSMGDGGRGGDSSFSICSSLAASWFEAPLRCAPHHEAQERTAPLTTGSPHPEVSRSGFEGRGRPAPLFCPGDRSSGGFRPRCGGWRFGVSSPKLVVHHPPAVTLGLDPRGLHLTTPSQQSGIVSARCGFGQILKYRTLGSRPRVTT